MNATHLVYVASLGLASLNLYYWRKGKGPGRLLAVFLALGIGAYWWVIH